MTNLEDVADAADAVADEQRKVARTARQMQRAHDRGEPWAAILRSGRATGVVELLRSSAHRLRDASTALMSVLAHGLATEGESRRQIAKHLGVSHQRITTMLNNGSGRSAAGE